MTFITLENGGRINAANVISYFNHRDGVSRFEMSNGKIIMGKVWNENFEDAFYPIVPAAPGFYEIFADVQEDLSRRWYQRAIVGWKLTPGGNYPVLEGRIDGKDSVGQLYPDGSCRDDDGNRYKNLDELKAAIAEDDVDFPSLENSDKKEQELANYDDQPISCAVEIKKIYTFEADGDTILMAAAHALDTKRFMPFGIIVESSCYHKQYLGQSEIGSLIDAVGLTDLINQDELLNKPFILNVGKIGRERFTSYVAATKAA